MARIVPDWVDAFVEYAEPCGAPIAFRKWAAISAIAGALERKVWVRSNFGLTYPNVFIFLVGSSGSGKTITSIKAYDLLKTVRDVKIAPNNVSRASLIDVLAHARRDVVNPRGDPPTMTFNALSVHARELGVLVPAYDTDFMSHLTDLYDCDKYEEKKRGGDLHIEIEKTWLNLLGDCTPSYLAGTMPEGAWEQGFMSRTIMVYSTEEANTRFEYDIAEDQPKERDTRYLALKNDIAEINKIYGAFKFRVEAGQALANWKEKGCPPRLTHPRLQAYNARRFQHMLKLVTVACASRTDEKIIELEDYQRALGWLLEAEHVMPDIFRAMTSGGDANAMQDTWDFVLREQSRTQSGVPRSKVLGFLGQRVHARDIDRVLGLMLDTAQLHEEMTEKGLKAYRAGALH